MHPAFPDLVGDWAQREIAAAQRDFSACANDNPGDPANDLADPLFEIMARREIAATRLW
jgi:hypothetical protein